MSLYDPRTVTRDFSTLIASFGIICYTLCTITFFLERPLERVGTTSMRTANTAVMFATMILARGGHVTFDLAEVRLAVPGPYESLAHPRSRRCSSAWNTIPAETA